MKLYIIEYNNYYRISRIVYFLIYAFPLTIIIFFRGLGIESVFFRWGMLLLFGLWIVFGLITPYNKQGIIVINKEGAILIEQNNQHENITPNTITFLCGGYDGEECEVLEILFSGSHSRDGTKNFLIINGEKYQIFLNNQAELKNIQFIINELKNKGVNAEFKKET